MSYSEKERAELREAKRLDLEYRMTPKPKIPGRGAVPDVCAVSQNGAIESFVCECACGGGLVFQKTGETVSCHFCGSTWEARIDREAEVVALKSSIMENVMPFFRFRKIEVAAME